MKAETHSLPSYSSLRQPEFRLFLVARMCLTMGWQMQGVIVGWQVYQFTKDPFSLGLIGLAEAVPFILTSFYGGHAADRVQRKKLILLFTSVYFLCAVALLVFTLPFVHVLDHKNVLPVYGLIGLTGIARGFLAPAITAFFAQVLPREMYSNGITWSSNAWHLAAVSGPAIGGLIYGFAGITAANATVTALMAASLLLFMLIPRKPLHAEEAGVPFFQSLTAGIRFVFNNQVMLAALSLDMFAVLFGGAAALMPVFANDVLHVGPEGLGLMRAAPFAGSIVMGLLLAHRPPMQHAGKNLMWALAGFGLCSVCFGFSIHFWLSVLLLFLMGIFDSVSVIIRGTIVQLMTPDHMRGRVSSVNSIFIGSSNEIGAFESGLAAKLMGLIPSVVFGGTMTIGIVALTAWKSPALRKLNLRQLQDEISIIR